MLTHAGLKKNLPTSKKQWFAKQKGKTVQNPTFRLVFFFKKVILKKRKFELFSGVINAMLSAL